MLPSVRFTAPTSRARAVCDGFGQYLALSELRFFLDAPAQRLHVLGEVAPWHAIPRGHEVCRGG
jgi:hypothetical protein